MRLTEKQIEKRQRKAYLNREAIQPRDIVEITCTDADEKHCEFKLKSGDTLWCEQPFDTIKNEPMKSIRRGETITMWCVEVSIKSNGYGKFVDYRFKPDRMPHTVIINGPDAQALKIVEAYGWNN